ncbi:MAG: imidazoleglycerol-phosphate dehydratase [Candidatus Omnitrophica bacterium]|nr:imidazoleglycerol-phosphate dehydratase [Candidatus Omnitrophota bacterium]
MRRATVKRTSRETTITVTVNLDGSGKTAVRTGIPFLDHMVTLFGTHGLIDLSVRAVGDLDVDLHHTNEDVGLVMGQAVTKALGDGRGIQRFGWAYVPMEEALVRVVLDYSGRPKLIVRDQRAPRNALRGSGTAYQWEDFEHWLESFVRSAKFTVHIDIFSGRDFHHTCEAIVKAFGRAIRQAIQRDAGRRGIPSSKGLL